MRRNTEYARNAHLTGLSDNPSTFLMGQNTFTCSSSSSDQSSISRRNSSKSIISGIQKRRFAQNMRKLQKKYKQRKSMEEKRRKSMKSAKTNRGRGSAAYSRPELPYLKRVDSSSLTIESDQHSWKSKLKNQTKNKSDQDMEEKLEVQFQTQLIQISKVKTNEADTKKFLPLNQITEINEDLVTTPRLSRTRVEEQTDVKYEFDLEEGSSSFTIDDESQSISMEQSDSTYSEGGLKFQSKSRKDLIKQVHRLRHLKQYSRCLILPDDPWAVRWNFILIWVILVSSVITPLRAAFFEDDNWMWTLLESLIDIVYFLDIVLTFFSAYYNKIEELICNRGQIACGYLKSWFILDVVSVIPLSLFFNSASNKFGKIAKLPRIYQIVKTTKFMRVLKAVKARTRLRRKVSKTSNLEVQRLMLFLFVFVLLCHNLSCLWYLIARIQQFSEDTWVYSYNLIDASVQEQYLACLYFIVTTITTVGYGDITSKSPIEQSFCIVLMLIGVISYSMAISSITSVISDSNRKQKLLVSKLNVLSLLREEYDLSLDLYWRLRQSLHYEHEMDMSEKQDFVRQLPPKLRVELSNIMYTHQLNGVKYFENKSAGFVAALAPKLKPVKACKGDYIFMKGDSLDGIYFIKQGQASYVQRCPNADLIFATNRPGSFFGDIEFSLINQDAEPTRFFTVKARTDLDLLFLPKQDLYQIDNHYRKEVLSLFERSLSHLDKLKNMNRRSELWLEKRYSAHPMGNPMNEVRRTSTNNGLQFIERRATPPSTSQFTPKHDKTPNNDWSSIEPVKEERTRKTLKEELACKQLAYQERKSRKKTIKLEKEATARVTSLNTAAIQNAFRQNKEERKTPPKNPRLIPRQQVVVQYKNKQMTPCISTETSLQTDEADLSTHRELLSKIARKATSRNK